MKPLDHYVDAHTPRRCTCLVCGQIDSVTYDEIRDQLSHYCFWCASREAYEQGLAAEPQKWGITAVQAAQIILGDDYIARAKNGEVLDAAGLAAEMQHVWSPVEVECISCRTITRRSLSMTLGNRGDADRTRCFQCFAQPLTAQQYHLFETFGLVRNHKGYALSGRRLLRTA